MKGKSSLLVIIALGIVFSASEGYADINRGLGLGLFGGYAKAKDDDNGTYYLGATLEKRFLKFLGIRLEAGYRKDDLLEGNLGGSSVKIEATSVPVLISAVVHPFSDWLLSPYVIGGGGAYITQTKMSINPPLGGLKGPEETEVNMGYHLGAGLEVNLGEHISIQGDLRWVFLDIETGDLRDKVKEFDDDKKLPDTESNGIWATVGVKFFF